MRDHVRLIAATVISILGVLVSGTGWLFHGASDLLLNFNVVWLCFAGSYLVMTAVVFLHATPRATRSWAFHERRASRSVIVRWFIGDARGVWFIVSAAIFAVTSAVLMIRSDSAGNGEVILGSAGVILSWLMLQVAFTLHYAYAFFHGGGIVLDGEPEPDLFDFAYIAFTVGTAFTVVGTTITTRHMRRVVLGHSVLSFGFNTVLLGLVVSLLAA